MKKQILLISVVVASFILIGCGSEADDSSTTDNSSSAQLNDSPVSNIDYVTQSYKGITDSNGYFKYSMNDKNVTFKIGDLTIGSLNLSKLNKDKKVLPADLLGLDRSNTTNNKLLEMLQFLQSLDSDNNTSNGIQISDIVKQQITQELEENSSLNSNLSDNNISAIQFMVTQINKKFIDEGIARRHYESTLSSLGIKPEFSPFTTIWEITNDDPTIQIGTDTLSYIYNYSVDWGDGNVTSNVDANISHTYDTEGNYTVKITGDLPHLLLSKNDASQLVNITNWGDIDWKSFYFTFADTNNSSFEINATDTPNLKDVKDMSYMFIWSNINSPIDNWDVSNVKYMFATFAYSTAFNQPLNDWNTSNVVYMGSMFYKATAFNQPLDQWDTHNVKDMSYMFAHSTVFNQPLNNWDVSNVTDMSYMFYDSTAFNQQLYLWDTSKVTNIRYMFYEDSAFSYKDLSSWDISNVTDYAGFNTSTGPGNIWPDL